MLLGAIVVVIFSKAYSIFDAKASSLVSRYCFIAVNSPLSSWESSTSSISSSITVVRGAFVSVLRLRVMLSFLSPWVVGFLVCYLATLAHDRWVLASATSSTVGSLGRLVSFLRLWVWVSCVVSIGFIFPIQSMRPCSVGSSWVVGS
jgi:hypothetical protein